MRISCLYTSLNIAALAITTMAIAAPQGGTQKKPPAPKPPAVNQVKGQQQLAGASVQFGTVYSLKNGFNFAVLAARYTLEPFVAYAPLTAKTDMKLLVLDFAIKNANPDDNFFNPEDMLTLVDDKGQLYTGGSMALSSKKADTASVTLRPGQGLGQPELKDPLQWGFVIPEKARIVKIMVNQGRKGRNEDALRYYIAGATKEEAGENGDPKNVIAPLPTEARDPADASRSTPLPEGKGTVGTYAPSGSFALRLDSFAYSTDPLVDKNGPAEGKKFAVATVTAKNLMQTTPTMFDVTGGDDPLYAITDSDGEREKPVAYRQAKRDADPDHEFKPGDEYTFRVLFALPQDATAKTLILGTGNSRKWAYDVSGIK